MSLDIHAPPSQGQKTFIHSAELCDLARLDFMVSAMNISKDIGYFERQFGFQKKGDRQVYIIVHEGVDAGYCILNWDPKYAFFRKIGVPEIQDINILPHFRRQGLASTLIAYCEGAARARGLEYMGIGVSVSPAFGPAQILYAHLGYIPDGNGVTYDRAQTVSGEFRPLDDQLCMMMVKAL